MHDSAVTPTGNVRPARRHVGVHPPGPRRSGTRTLVTVMRPEECGLRPARTTSLWMKGSLMSDLLMSLRRSDAAGC